MAHTLWTMTFALNLFCGICLHLDCRHFNTKGFENEKWFIPRRHEKFCNTNLTTFRKKALSDLAGHIFG